MRNFLLEKSYSNVNTNKQTKCNFNFPPELIEQVCDGSKNVRQFFRGNIEESVFHELTQVNSFWNEFSAA